MAFGIAADRSHQGTRYLYDGPLYYHLETTAGGWKLGVLPDEFTGALVKILPLVQQPLLDFWFDVASESISFEDTVFRITGSVENSVREPPATLR